MIKAKILEMHSDISFIKTIRPKTRNQFQIKYKYDIKENSLNTPHEHTKSLDIKLNRKNRKAKSELKGRLLNEKKTGVRMLRLVSRFTPKHLNIEKTTKIKNSPILSIRKMFILNKNQ